MFQLDKEALEDPPPSAAIEAELKTNQLTEDEAAEKVRRAAQRSLCLSLTPQH